MLHHRLLHRLKLHHGLLHHLKLGHGLLHHLKLGHGLMHHLMLLDSLPLIKNVLSQEDHQVQVVLIWECKGMTTQDYILISQLVLATKQRPTTTRNERYMVVVTICV
jgi:hypothetical protein